MSSCCGCKEAGGGGGGGIPQGSLPMLCLVPRDGAGPGKGGTAPRAHPVAASAPDDFQLLGSDYIKKHFDLPKRALYLDPVRKPLITFPMTQEGRNSMFNMAKKTKINQGILDGIIDPSEAIKGPSVFPYPRTDGKQQDGVQEEDEEIIYILQLPDFEAICPTHNTIIKTPRFIWHTCKKQKDEKQIGLKSGKGPLHKPKPWLLSRHTDFDLQSQW